MTRPAPQYLALSFVVCCLAVLAGWTSRPPAQAPTSLLVEGGSIIDGTGAPARRAALRIEGDTIVAIADRLEPRPGERVIHAAGLAVAPGFIDAHSHAAHGLHRQPDAESQVRQGITTAIVGQDGSSELPIAEFLEGIESRSAGGPACACRSRTSSWRSGPCGARRPRGSEFSRRRSARACA